MTYLVGTNNNIVIFCDKTKNEAAEIVSRIASKFNLSNRNTINEFIVKKRTQQCLHFNYTLVGDICICDSQHHPNDLQPIHTSKPPNYDRIL